MSFFKFIQARFSSLRSHLLTLLGKEMLGGRLEFSGMTLGGTTQVRTIDFPSGRQMRLLLVEDTQQSALWLDDPYGDLPFPYLQRFDLAFYENNAPEKNNTPKQNDASERLLLIGGGGFAWPRHMLANYPSASLDVVELDEQIVTLARKWFYVDELERQFGSSGENRLHIYTVDGRSYLESMPPNKRYDVILNDCFIAHKPAESLMDVSAAELIHAHLNANGMYISNIVSALMGPQATILNTVIHMLCAHFAYVDVIPCSLEEPTEPGNIVVIASDQQRNFPGTWMSCTGETAN